MQRKKYDVRLYLGVHRGQVSVLLRCKKEDV